MRLRLLKTVRIAVTAVPLLVCGLLIVLWVRSYWKRDSYSIAIRNHTQLSCMSHRGRIEILYWTMPKIRDPKLIEVSYARSPLRPLSKQEFEKFLTLYGPSHSLLRFECNETRLRASVPYWFYLTIFAAIAALPWIKWRFSLRTLLIVLTLFALFFGAIAMSMRGL